ncbi:hypothetical protein QQZ08_009054 [Neonectria magnoliae]|uniref:Kinesin light chain n=1 Tax=Neonectria magnoliae TaxID=2732573 RepID=A0ABR1HRE5_9HYPO
MKTWCIDKISSKSSMTSFLHHQDTTLQRFMVLEDQGMSPIDQQTSVTLEYDASNGLKKTQVALQFAYDRDNEHGRLSIFWVHADNEATFTYDYKEIAKKLGIGGDVDGEDLLKAVRDDIVARKPWLLVLDNADDLALFGTEPAKRARKRDLHEYIPKAPGGTVLWTSRDARISGTLVGGLRAIEVPSMSVDEARKLLATTGDEGNNGEEMTRDALLEELQYFPLAISQAGAYMHQTSTTVEEYLTLLKRSQDRWNLLKESSFDRHRRRDMPNSVLETWCISIERIRQENRIAYRILHAIAYLDNQNIPLELITAICRDGTASTTEQVEDPMETRMAIKRLRQFSFLREYSATGNGRSYEVHKLVQEATRYGLSMMGSGENKNGENNMGRDGEAQYASIARAESLKREALALRREVLGEKHPNTLDSIASLATTCGTRGRYSESEPLHQEALDLRREVLGEKHLDTICSISSLATTYREQGRYSEARPLHQKTLDLRLEILGEKHLDTMYSMADLATTYRHLGRYSEAEKLNIRSLDLRTEILGEKHPHTIGGMAGLAATYHAQGRYPEDEEIYIQALDLGQEVLGEKHPLTIGLMAKLATIYR